MKKYVKNSITYRHVFSSLEQYLQSKLTFENFEILLTFTITIEIQPLKDFSYQNSFLDSIALDSQISTDIIAKTMESTRKTFLASTARFFPKISPNMVSNET